MAKEREREGEKFASRGFQKSKGEKKAGGRGPERILLFLLFFFTKKRARTNGRVLDNLLGLGPWLLQLLLVLPARLACCCYCDCCFLLGGIGVEREKASPFWNFRFQKGAFSFFFHKTAFYPSRVFPPPRSLNSPKAGITLTTPPPPIGVFQRRQLIKIIISSSEKYTISQTK